MAKTSLSMDDLKVYFRDDEWSLMSDYEKNSCLNRLQNYEALQNLGFPASKPDFIDQDMQAIKAKELVGTIMSKKKLKQQINCKKQENEKNIPVLHKKRKKRTSCPAQSTNISTPANKDVRDIETKTMEKTLSSKKEKSSDAKEKPNDKVKLIFSETEKKNAIYLDNLLSTALKLNKLYKRRGINVLKEVTKLWTLKKIQHKDENKVIESQNETETTINEVKLGKNERNKNKRKIIKSKDEANIIKKNKKIDNMSNKIKDMTKGKNNENKKLKVKKLDNKVNANTVILSEPAKKEGKPTYNGRYPKRNIPLKNYTEEEILEDDDYIFCDDCQKEWPGDCPEHGPLIHLVDRKIAKDEKDPLRAIKTTPPQLEVAESEILGAGKGVWTKCVIPPRVIFGPYDGIKTPTPDELGYSWRVMKNKRISYFVSGKYTGSSNWMRYVNSARYEKELNVFAFQFKGEIYYRTFKHIAPKTELKVWYGKEFNIRLGISPESFKNPNIKLIKNSMFPCRQCHLAFTSPLYLQKHKYYCSAKRFDKKKTKDLKNDIPQRLTHIQTKQIQKNICHHLRTRTNCENTHNTFTCRKYNFESIECYHLQESIQNDTGQKTNRCEICSYKFNENVEPQKNITNHSGKKLYNCEICGHESTKSSHLKQHLRTHSGEKPYSCEICGYKCTTSGSLKYHLRTHSGEKPYSCEICGYKCTTSGNLKKHFRTHSGEKPYSCEICGYKCTTSGNLKYHFRTHSGEKPYSCEICGYKCTTNGSLKKHFRTHTGEKPYTCEICGYKCTTNGSLKKHFRTHTGEKPYSCEICGYKCTESGRLKKHLKIHSGEKPYSCEICGYKCFESGRLKKHLKIHSGEKPYSCEICGYKCIQSSNLKEHFRTHS